jgi:hypothetical protein
MSFSKKAAEIMHTLQSDYGMFHSPKRDHPRDVQEAKVCKHTCSSDVRVTSPAVKKSTRESLLLQQPIILEKNNHAKSASSSRTMGDKKIGSFKTVTPYVPNSNSSTRNLARTKYESTTNESLSRAQEMEILHSDHYDKDNLQKLFRKIHSLTAELAKSEQEKLRLQLRIDHMSDMEVACKEYEKTISKL